MCNVSVQYIIICVYMYNQNVHTQFLRLSCMARFGRGNNRYVFNCINMFMMTSLHMLISLVLLSRLQISKKLKPDHCQKAPAVQNLTSMNNTKSQSLKVELGYGFSLLCLCNCKFHILAGNNLLLITYVNASVYNFTMELMHSRVKYQKKDINQSQPPLFHNHKLTHQLAVWLNDTSNA